MWDGVRSAVCGSNKSRFSVRTLFFLQNAHNCWKEAENEQGWVKIMLAPVHSFWEVLKGLQVHPFSLMLLDSSFPCLCGRNI